jgi:CBS domain-containing protein
VVEDDEVVGILTRADVMGALRRAVAGEKPRGPA